MERPEAPPVGFEVHQRYNTYRVTDVIPYVRKSDGKETYVLVWESECHDCGCKFSVTTGMQINKYMNRRCAEHAQACVKTHKRNRGNAKQ